MSVKTKYGPCPSCNRKCVARPGYCWEDDIRYWYIECDKCEHLTDYWENASHAVDEWNGIEDDEDEDEDETVASLVRMLEQERSDNNDLRQENSRLRVYSSQPDETKKVEEIKKEMRKANDFISRLKGDAERIEKNFKSVVDSKDALQKKVVEWRESMFLIDMVLVSMKVAKSYPDTVSPIMSIQDLLDTIRDQVCWPPRYPKTFDTPLEEIIWLSSPHGPSPRPSVYLKSMRAHLTPNGHPDKDNLVTATYGHAMDRFGTGSRGYTLAWEALGCPGRTVHTNQRPRT